jgi:DNA repair photolyase
VNEVPGASRMPFRFTINAYRGCSHACVYCFARPTHEYLGLNIGDDFDRKVVVKVNAVERLRAELRDPRWRGDGIAMGTNTDPYQRCEGKFHLTRGLVEVLGEAANPFSILTKSTLILRDLDLLCAAAARTSVRANFSIATLDEAVWKATEPGTPHPRKRVEAVAKLNEVGVECGVLVAPVLPGLSDAPAQLEDVVKACVDAGARSISPILLHLRPGVREHYLRWLAEARPDLVPLYEQLYPRAYAPKKTQEELARVVRGLVARHRGVSASPRSARATSGSGTAAPDPPKRAPRRSPAARQLSLDV